MENLHRPRKSRRASVTVEGSKQIQEKTGAPNSTHNSRCRYDSRANEDMFMVELGESAFKQVMSKPVKNLIAEEMLNEVKSKRNAPNVVARLMGLDALPSPQQLTRHERRLPESFRQRKEQRDAPSTAQFFVDQASRRNYMELHEVNDLNEDLEASHIANRHYSTRWNTRSEHNTDMPEVAVIQRKYIEATHFSADEKLQNSKGYLDIPEELEFNDKLLLKCLQQRDSLISKHFLNLQVDTSSSMCSHIAVLKPATSANSQGTSILGKPERGASWHHDINLPMRRDDGHLFHLQHPHASHSSFKSPKNHVKGKDESNFPTRIVVLKPNCGKTHCDATSVHYPAEEKKHTRRLSSGARKSGLVEMKNSSKYAGVSNLDSKEAREIAKQITARMRNSHGPLNVRKDCSLIYSDIIGYATDESSCGMYENDSGSELDMLKLSLGNLYCRNNQCKSPLTGTVESSVSKEAKKRLSERWKLSQRCQDMETVSKGGTLGEMLSLPDRETGAGHLDTMVTDACEYPLGISSRDGWKDAYVSSKSRSLPPLGSQIQGTGSNSRNLRPKSMDRIRNKSCDGSQSQMEEDSFNDNRSGKKKLRSSCHKGAGANDTLQEAVFCKMMNTSAECNLPVSKDKNAISVIDSESFLDLIQEPFVESNETLFLDQDASDLKETSIQLSREGGHPSPVSVLEELTFTEDSLSGSESLEIVSAKINDLRMKIQQLKMKPDSRSDVAADNDDDDEVQQPAMVVVDEKFRSMSPSWESSYISDVLMVSGFKDSDPDAFIATCHSPDCPLSPSTFESLEKKYSASESRHARRHLFDRVNLALLEILQQHVDPCPWLKQKRDANLGCQKQEVADTLHRLLADQASVANRDTSERILEREMRWLDVRDEINTIGKDIEKAIVDELITEIIMTWTLRRH